MWARILICLITLFSVPAWTGALAIKSDLDQLELPGFADSKDPLPVADSASVAEISSGIASLVPSSKLQCVNDVVAGTLFQKTKGQAGDEVWKSNSGVKASYKLMMAKSPCMAVLTEKYYSKIKTLDPNIAPGASDRLPSGRPALSAVVGQGSFTGNSPGYALDEALAVTKGRKALAMALIGYCGHDDDQNSFPFVIDLSNQKSRFAVLRYYDATAAKNGVLPKENEKSAFTKVRNTLEKSDRVSLSVKCPSNTSSFYAAQALGKDADIPTDVKSYVSRIQAPNKGAGALPGKAYHLGFAAVMGCRLTSCGLSKESSQSILALIANRYRSTRQSSTSQKYDDVRRMIEERFDVNWSDERGLKAVSKDINAWLQSSEGKQAIIDNGGAEFFAGNRAKMTWDMWKTNIDTAILNKGGIQGNTFTASRFSEGRDPYWDPKSISKPQQSFCPTWSEERCNNARKKYETYGADFDWTEAQQKSGAGFGSDLCKQEKASGADALEKQACEALDELSKASSGGSSGTSSGTGSGTK